MIAQDVERSVSGFAVDETTGKCSRRAATSIRQAIVKYDSQGNVLKRLDGLSGLAQVDPVHDRVYLFERRTSGGLSHSIGT